jgi:hypothetical protein
MQALAVKGFCCRKNLQRHADALRGILPSGSLRVKIIYTRRYPMKKDSGWRKTAWSWFGKVWNLGWSLFIVAFNAVVFFGLAYWAVRSVIAAMAISAAVTLAVLLVPLKTAGKRAKPSGKALLVNRLAFAVWVFAVAAAAGVWWYYLPNCWARAFGCIVAFLLAFRPAVKLLEWMLPKRKEKPKQKKKK